MRQLRKNTGIVIEHWKDKSIAVKKNRCVYSFHINKDYAKINCEKGQLISRYRPSCVTLIVLFAYSFYYCCAH